MFMYEEISRNINQSTFDCVIAASRESADPENVCSQRVYIERGIFILIYVYVYE